MLCGGVAAVCTVRCVECTQPSVQYTYRTYDMLPHHLTTYNEVTLYRILT